MPKPIGELLTQARMDRGLTLEDVSQATMIRVTYLRALEAEDWSAMPAPAYARGFLRTYAEQRIVLDNAKGEPHEGNSGFG